MQTNSVERWLVENKHFDLKKEFLSTQMIWQKVEKTGQMPNDTSRHEQTRKTAGWYCYESVLDVVRERERERRRDERRREKRRGERGIKKGWERTAGFEVSCVPEDTSRKPTNSTDNNPKTWSWKKGRTRRGKRQWKHQWKQAEDGRMNQAGNLHTISGRRLNEQRQKCSWKRDHQHRHRLPHHEKQALSDRKEWLLTDAHTLPGHCNWLLTFNEVSNKISNSFLYPLHPLGDEK